MTAKMREANYFKRLLMEGRIDADQFVAVLLRLQGDK